MGTSQSHRLCERNWLFLWHQCWYILFEPVCSLCVFACVLWFLLARAGKGFLFLWFLPRQSRDPLGFLCVPLSLCHLDLPPQTWRHLRSSRLLSCLLFSLPVFPLIISRPLCACDLLFAPPFPTSCLKSVTPHPPPPFFFLSFSQLPLWHDHWLFIHNSDSFGDSENENPLVLIKCFF